MQPQGKSASFIIALTLAAVLIGCNKGPDYNSKMAYGGFIGSYVWVEVEWECHKAEIALGECGEAKKWLEKNKFEPSGSAGYCKTESMAQYKYCKSYLGDLNIWSPYP